MQKAPPDNYPITGICIVADPTKCPPGYEVMYRSYDKNEDCDLWKDSFFRSKVTRYLCYTRVYPLEGGNLNNVLADIVLNYDREEAPEGFEIIDFTVDTREKATRKKQICLKMISRDAAHDAISELIILSRNRRPPMGYTLVGEMNGLSICFKMDSVPPDTKSSPGDSTEQPKQPVNGYNNNIFAGFPYWQQPGSTPAVPSAAAPPPPTLPPSTTPTLNPGEGSACDKWTAPRPQSSTLDHWRDHVTQQRQSKYEYNVYGHWAYPVTGPTLPYASHWSQSGASGSALSAPVAAPVGDSRYGRATLQKQDSLIMPSSALSGVPFQLNTQFRTLDSLRHLSVKDIHHRSLNDIENEYNYPFRIERQAANQIPYEDE